MWKEKSINYCCGIRDFVWLMMRGYHGKGERFVIASGRDSALLNKGCVS